jgi:membrane protein insertase Oxa1/YidC/SpoIIIJ
MSWYNVGSYVMDTVHLIHDWTGLSYALSIASLAALSRLVFIVPVAIQARRNDAIQKRIEPNIRKLEQDFRRARDVRRKASIQAQIKSILATSGYQRNLKYKLPLVSLSITLTMWYSMRYMASYYPTELATGGHLWFIDLTQPDPLYYLPFLSVSTFVIMGETGADMLGRPTDESTRSKWLWRAFRVITLPIFAMTPAAVQCFWIPHATLSLAQVVLLSQPEVLRYLDIPVPKESTSSSNTTALLNEERKQLVANKKEEDTTQTSGMQEPQPQKPAVLSSAQSRSRSKKRKRK